MRKIVDFLKTTAGMVLIVTLAIGVIVHAATGNFFTPYNISTLSRAASFVIIVGFAQTLVLLTGGIRMQIYKGIVYVITKGMPITGMPDNAEKFANGIIGKVLPNIVIIMVLLCVLLTIMLKRTKFGRYVYALGGNRSCAKIVGIATERVELLVYALSGTLSAFAGVMMACKLASFQASIGESWQMDSITAAVLGGTSMAGGVGSVVGTIIGGFLSSVISTCITLLRISSYWETIVTGLVVLIAVFVDAIRENVVLREQIKRLFGKRRVKKS